MEFCSKCMTINPMFKTSYGNVLCDECWDEYLDTEKGKVEYFVRITKGEVEMSSFDADFLGEVVSSWKNYKDQLDLSEKEKALSEEIAMFLGLL